VHRGPKRAFETGNIDGFLHGYRNSVKRTGRTLVVELAGAPQSAIDIKVNECAHNRIQLGDSRKATLCYLSCGTLVCPQERDQLDCRKSMQRFRYRWGSHGNLLTQTVLTKLKIPFKTDTVLTKWRRGGFELPKPRAELCFWPDACKKCHCNTPAAGTTAAAPRDVTTVQLYASRSPRARPCACGELLATPTQFCVTMRAPAPTVPPEL
jgi:hypothetical protein